jgi:transcriptional regulator with XRE-family HTH domain
MTADLLSQPPVPTPADLGRALRRLRRKRRLTIETLAHAANVHPTYLSAIERGIRNPSWTKVCALTNALEISIAVLARDTETEAHIGVRTRQIRSEMDAHADHKATTERNDI